MANARRRKPEDETQKLNLMVELTIINLGGLDNPAMAWCGDSNGACLIFGTDADPCGELTAVGASLMARAEQFHFE